MHVCVRASISMRVRVYARVRVCLRVSVRTHVSNSWLYGSGSTLIGGIFDKQTYFWCKFN